MEATVNEARGSKRRTRILLGVAVLGVLLGAAGTLSGVAAFAPGMMIVTYESRLGVDETVEALKQSVEAQGWNVVGTRDMRQSLARHGVEFSHEVRSLEICKADYASQVLTDDRYLCSLMPCSISVWQADDGKVYISKMNTGLMGKLFGGTVARVMGGSVASDERAILADIIVR